ncbi:hypothetical protein [Oceanicoccus sp. KOV_DT_Chl]|uniref:hypothetical protein n=1 Tax=Oceanicoccus sp. KOV_DT_Chl TaxID=1904639 RepID=UPI000C7D8A4B|nr:hypothetical protein [Oceanicoccus sp. KOV_DT_Chl]
MFRLSIHFLLVSSLTYIMPGAVLAFDDPTMPASFVQSSSPKRLTLESILYSDTRKVATISGQVLAEGDSIDGKKILYIGRDSVRLADDAKELTLTLKRSSIRQVK